MPQKKKPKKPNTRPTELGDALTTVSSRLMPAELETVRKAANLRGWSVAQFVQRAAVERATEVLNCYEDRGGIGATAAELLETLESNNRRRELEVEYGGTAFSSESPAWRFLGHDAEFQESGLLLEEHGLFAISSERAMPNSQMTEYRLSVYPLDKSQIQFEDYSEVLTASRPKPILAIRQFGSSGYTSKVAEAVINGGREFGEMLSRSNRSNSSPFLIAEEILSSSKVIQPQDGVETP